MRAALPCEIRSTKKFSADNNLCCCAASSDGETVAFGGRGATVRIYNNCLETSKLDSEAISLSFHPDGTSLAVGGEAGVVIWNLSSEGRRREELVGSPCVYQVAFSPDGAMLLVCHGDGNRLYRRVICVDESSGRRSYKWELEGSYTSRAMYCGAFSPNSSRLVVAGMDKIVYMWEPCTTPFTPEPPTPDRKSDRKNSERGGSGITIAYHNPPNELRGHTDWIACCAFSADSQTLATGGHDGTCRLWSVSNRNCVRILPHLSAVVCCTFVPWGTAGSDLLVTGCDTLVRLWGSGGHSVVGKLHTDTVEGVCIYGKSKNRLLTVSGDSTAREWMLLRDKSVLRILSRDCASITMLHPLITIGLFGPASQLLTSRLRRSLRSLFPSKLKKVRKGKWIPPQSAD
ncbi:hypothetical protein AAMO2058_001251900 [Amorphochlora amoebiformis]